ncbi:glycoside hydrolase family 28 protein [Halocatena pleomorpha]|uniref:Glycoside hydrolase family 28 protein n=1 Tax=Halocatena pleomorpha TaxID=1785090 RepID=A0A3P3RAZ4_9EURY|nr:glycoside hydrolase family 28 protein [Halocatena pleomorpha]RRJ30098.1 glycoside hydrolase family 28 protein [Halocatena pleomorpha]
MTVPDTDRFDIREYGATGDGDDPETGAIQAALDACAETGGTVYVPSETYVTGPLRVGGDTTLYLAPGATLRFVGDYSAYPTVESRWEGWDQAGFHPCLFVENAENVTITGRGTIDGNGAYWWELYETPTAERPTGLQERLAEFERRNEKGDDVSSFTHRPPLCQIANSDNVTVSGIRLCNSPFWNTHIVYSENVTIHDVAIENPADAPNGDGIDIDSSRCVRISDTYINAGDDAICIKSGKNAEGRAVGESASEITVTNCTVESGHGGVVIGSEMSGDVRDVAVSNCTFTDTDRGVRIKTQRDRGGVIEDLRFDNILMRRIACPFVINGYYFTPLDSDPQPVTEGTPMVRNVSFRSITARSVETAGFLAGLPEQHFEGVSFSDVRIDATRDLDATELDPAMAAGYEQRHGLFCKSIADISFRDVRIRAADGPAMRFEATDDVRIDGMETETEDAPAVSVHDVTRTRIRGCLDSAETPFLRASGSNTQTISIAECHGPVADAVEVTPDSDATVERF